MIYGVASTVIKRSDGIISPRGETLATLSGAAFTLIFCDIVSLRLAGFLRFFLGTVATLGVWFTER